MSKGGCLCGEIRYAVLGEPLAATFCHCRSCRLAAGGPAVAWLIVRAGELVIEQGMPSNHAIDHYPRNTRDSAPLPRG